MYRSFKTHQRGNQRGLTEVNDMINAWVSLANCGTNTAKYINELKQGLSAKYKELLSKKDEILVQYRDGISSLKRIELHKKLRKDPNVKEYLIDIYYNEKSMD